MGASFIQLVFVGGGGGVQKEWGKRSGVREGMERGMRGRGWYRGRCEAGLLISECGKHIIFQMGMAVNGIPVLVDLLNCTSPEMHSSACDALRNTCSCDIFCVVLFCINYCVLSIYFSRGLNGIPVMVDLLNSPSPEIHSSACGSLRNISFGKAMKKTKWPSKMLMASQR